MNQPKVSVIIPVYNSEQYLRQCLDSIVNQTLRDIEIITVDDGSTDNSLDILRDYEARDSRITVKTQNNRFAGAARNTGMEVARGEYLSFLDSDDFFERNMLKKAYEKCVSCDADVGLYKAKQYIEISNKFIKADWVLKKQYLPNNDPFSYRDIPGHIFQLSSSCPWNKLFKSEFIHSSELAFQETHSANDVSFVYMACLLARRITVIDKYLVNYRTGINTNLQSTKDKYPLAFYDAFLSLKKSIEETGLYPEVEQSFVNVALSNCYSNLETMKSDEAYRLVYQKLKDEVFKELGIDARAEDYFYSKNDYRKYLDIMRLTPNEYLYALKIKALQNEITDLRLSHTYKVGYAVTFIPRKIKGLFRHHRN
ncbi:MAG: glycosyltransferase family 2 protein [Dehalobacterium sp.]